MFGKKIRGVFGIVILLALAWSGLRQPVCAAASADGAEKNDKVIEKAFKSCDDYKALAAIGFSPCEALEERLSEIDLRVKGVKNFAFRKCAISGEEDRDIIMTVDVETGMYSVTILMVFVNSDTGYRADVSEVSVSRHMKYQLLDIDHDGQSELLLDSIWTHQRVERYLQIYQWSEKGHMKSIFKRSVCIVGERDHRVSYCLRKGEVVLTVKKLYINTEYKSRTARKMRYWYRYKNGRYILRKQKVLFRSLRKDFRSWTVG